METKILPINAESLSLAADIIREGGVVAFPTETVYGLGGSAVTDGAVIAIYSVKGRPSDNR